jgi:UDP-GlcNAc:undecaprenyl-phosphate GlcNAc-1-phosphate transferase
MPSLIRFHDYFGTVLPKLGIIFAGGLLIHLLGLADDVWKEKITYRIKFIVQIIVILGVAIAGIRVEFMPSKGLDILMTVIWIVGLTNSFNLLDNMDGLTAGVSIISAGLFFLIAVLQAQVFIAFLLAALAGGCLGFLFYNFYPSKLFMGDSGSLFLGYMFGVITVMGSYVVPESVSHIPVVVPIIVLSIPLYDTFSVIFIRWREKRPLFVGDKKHFSHRLVELGMSHRAAVVFIYLVSLCVGLVALLLPYISQAGMIVVLIQAVIIYTLITILIGVGKQNQETDR